jgi:Ca-activated chloride channel family protein
VFPGFFAFVFMFAGAALPQAQVRAVVNGTVVDAALKPVAGAKITLERGGVVVSTATTDAKGVFRFANVAAGDYQVRAERSGLPTTVRLLRVAAGASALNLPIVMATFEEAARADAKAAEQQAGNFRTAVPPPGAPIPPPAGQAGGGGRGGGATAVIASPLPRPYVDDFVPRPYYGPGGETYAPIDPNRFQPARERPLSTFGADVDTASYANVRRFLSTGQLPPRDAVRVEELINYFQFPYQSPRSGRPISITTEVGECPWAPSHKLVLIGARAASSSAGAEIAGRNIVLLVDVSGSMAPPERLPMIKTALGMFVDTLRADDTLSIVTYAGTSGVALRPTPASNRTLIQRTIASLNANGSTNGAQGLTTAYRIARQAYIPGGVNRVILATDGDFNVGITSYDDLLRLIERERESGVFLSVFGVGSGNLKDATMEMLADRGNGHYAYLDSLQEARRMLIREGNATLETVAKDVKFQVEFNPALVSAWKLIGYENRLLAPRDFNNDRKDAGEMGAGHSVTVLYEIIPVGAERGDDVEESRPDVDPLRYQPARGRAGAPGDGARGRAGAASVPANLNGEWLTVKARYKLPESETSQLITQPVRTGDRMQHLPLAAAVAEYGLLLRDAPHNRARWEALAQRLGRVAVPASLRQDVDGLKELVATGASLARMR